MPSSGPRPSSRRSTRAEGSRPGWRDSASGSEVAVKRPIAGGAGGGAARLEVALPRPHAAQPPRLTRMLESERLLASLLLAPTVVLLGLFIAYPFAMGGLLAPRRPDVVNVRTVLAPANSR